VSGVLLLELLVAVPVPYALPHGVGAIEQLNEAHAPLHQSTREHAVAREAGAHGIRIISAVEPAHRRGLAVESHGLRHRELHAGSELVARDPRAEGRVLAALGQVPSVEAREELPGAAVAPGLHGCREVPGRPLG
jgi:hypothetical protein